MTSRRSNNNTEKQEAEFKLLSSHHQDDIHWSGLKSPKPETKTRPRETRRLKPNLDTRTDLQYCNTRGEYARRKVHDCEIHNTNTLPPDWL